MTTPTTVQVRFQFRADTAANWTSIDPVLLANELGRETDTGKIKIGDGTTAWSSLAYQGWSTLTYPLVNADIASDAAIDHSKLADITAGSVLLGNASNVPTATALSGDVTVNSSGVTAISTGAIVDADVSASAEIAVSKLANGTANQILTTDGTDVTWTDSPTIAGNVIISGNLTVNGTETIINVDTLQVEDKTIEMGNVTTPTNLTADGGGIVLKGASDKTLLWVDSTDSWTSSENIDLASGKTYKIAGTDVLSATALGSAVTDSSLTSVGNLTDLTVDTDTLVVDATNSRVGINTTSPEYPLHVNSDALFSGATPILYFQPTLDTQQARFTFLNASGTSKAILRYEYSDDALTYTFGSSELLRVDSSGRLLVGISTAELVHHYRQNGGNRGNLQVVSTGTGANAPLFATFGDHAFSPQLSLAKSRGTTADDYTIVQDGDDLGTIYFFGSDGTDLRTAGAGIRSRVDGTPGADDMPGRIQLLTTPSGSATPLVRMTIKADGKVGIGQTEPGALLDVNGDALINGLTIGKGASSLTGNTAIGVNVLGNATTDGGSNTGVGYIALQDLTTGPNNTAVGASAGQNVTEGSGNSFFGRAAGSATTTGDGNNGFGTYTLQDNTTGINNIAIGSLSLNKNVAGAGGVAVGHNSQRYANDQTTFWTNTNTSVGYQSLMGSTTAADNTGASNTAIGYQSMVDNTTGDGNAAIGAYALNSNTTGDSNVAVGSNALGSNTTGAVNAAVGRYALNTSVAVDQCTAIGFESQRYADNTTTNKDGNNTSVGYRALRGSTTAANNTGVNNTAVGVTALTDNTSGDYNVAVGVSALADNTTGSKNVAVGNASLYRNTTGIENSALGHNAGRYEQDGSEDANFNNCTYLGYDTRASGDNQVQLGNSATTTYAYGSVQDRSDERDKTDIRDTVIGLDFINTLRPVDFRWDMRDDYFDTEVYEEEETETVEAPNPAYVEGGDEPEFIEETRTKMVTKDRLVPVAKDGSRKRNRFHHGLIAQEVKAAADAAGVDFAGYQDHSVGGGKDVLTLGYSELIAPLIKAVQELTAENAALKARLDAAGL